MDVGAYLRRISYDGSLEPTLDTLRALHRAHLFAVPFENFDIALRRPIALYRDRLFQKIVAHRRGGFCYELNGLFSELLKSIGFDVMILSARVTSTPGHVGPDFDHLVLRVNLPLASGNEIQSWLADVGFGDSFLEPLQLRAGTEHEQRGYVYKLTETSGHWSAMRRKVPEQRWEGMYDFEVTPRQLADFAGMCRYHQTSPDSHFTKGRLCSLATTDGRKTLAGNRLILTKNSQKTEREVNDGELRPVLKDEFGIVLD